MKKARFTFKLDAYQLWLLHQALRVAETHGDCGRDKREQLERLRVIVANAETRTKAKDVAEANAR